MTKRPEKEVLSGSKHPKTTTGEMKDALAGIHDYLSELFGNDSADKETALQTPGIDLPGLNAKIDQKPDTQTIESLLSTTLDTVRTEMNTIRTELANDIARNSVPAGTIACFAMSGAPDGYLKADSSTLSRNDYPALFAAIGTTFGEGDGSTTFTLPDLRGEFIRGWDDGRGTDTDRAFGTAQGDTIRNITGGFGFYGLQDCNLADGAFYKSGEKVSGYSHVAQGYTSDVVRIDASRSVPTANENRPRNIALLACIKY